MSELITQQPDAPQESQFEKFAPLIKSLAAIGVGAFGNSGMSRGIATGLANSATEDIRVKQLMDEARREQTEKDIKARQEQTKLRFDTIYKIWNGIKDPKAKALYADNMNLPALGEELLGTSFQLPATPASPKGLSIDTRAIRTSINAITDPATKARAEVYYGVMQQAIAGGKGAVASLNMERLNGVLTPTLKTYYKEDGSGAEDFPDAKTAYDAGYPRSTYPGVDTNDPAKDGKEDLKKQVSEINQATEALEIKSFVKYDNETVNYVKAFENIGSKISGALLLAGGLDVNVPTISSPFPGTIDGPYHLLAASNFIKGVVTNALDNPGLSERLGTMPGIEQVIKDNISTINQMAEDLKAADQNRAPITIGGSKKQAAPGTTEQAPPSQQGNEKEEFIKLVIETEGKSRAEAEAEYESYK
jgi:hypothetical protein